MNSEFDYIIVGAGSAGSVVARRLSENGLLRILVLEAGQDTVNPWQKIPLGVGRIVTDKRYVWNYSSTPQAGLDGRALYSPRGRLTGGTSAINGMIYARGDARRFDEWRDGGAPGWGYDELLPYFRKTEDRPGGDTCWRGTGGPTTVSDRPSADPLGDRFIAACKAAGVAENPDYNGAGFEGVGRLQYNIRNGLRWDSGRAYLSVARKRPNVTLVTRAVVERLAFDGRAATGVVYRVGGHRREARARGEVILSAGPINSPKLLELSGIGAGARLQELGVAVTHDLKGVGENLQDHLMVRMLFETVEKGTINGILNNPVRGLAEGLKYVLARRGLLASSMASAMAVVTSSPDQPYPDLRIQMQLIAASSRYNAGNRLSCDPYDGFSIATSQLYPYSRGTTHITAPDPEAKPAIDPAYLSDERDRAAIVSGLRQIRRLTQQEPLKHVIVRQVAPDPGKTGGDALLAFARETGHPAFHHVGSCRMGRDPMAVVDPELRVRGIDRLRVIDSSIMPTLPTSNTNAPTLAIAEKGADLILGKTPVG